MFGFLGGEKTYTINIKAMDDFVTHIQKRRKKWNEQVAASQQRAQEAILRTEKELVEDTFKTNAE